MPETTYVVSDHAQPLLATKVHPPQGRSGRLVDREALVDRLVAGQSGRLTVISAPAGWGKTTLVLQWRRRIGAGQRFGWVSLDESDSDPTSFWAYLTEALSVMYPDRTAAARRLAGLRRPDLGELLGPALVNSLAGVAEHGVLVLDDYQAVGSPRVDRQLTFLVDHLPDCLHLAVVSRTEPALPLARLRASGELTELHAADLRFTPGEAENLLTGVLGLRLGQADVLSSAAADGRLGGRAAPGCAVASHQPRPHPVDRGVHRRARAPGAVPHGRGARPPRPAAAALAG